MKKLFKVISESSSMSIEKSNPQISRIVGLDLLRIGLALLIFMFHSWMHFGCNYYCLNDFVSVGAIAMTGFFLLSGYSLRLVYGQQDLMDKTNLWRFYLKRLFGVLPLYYVIALTHICLFRTGTITGNLLLFPIEILGLQSTFSSLFTLSHNTGTWFISCLLLAYLIYPFLQTICKQVNARYKILLLLCLVFLDVWSSLITNYFDISWTYDNPFYRVLEFACGMIVADLNLTYSNKLLVRLRSWWALIILTIVLVMGVSIMRHTFQFNDYMLYNIIALPCFILMLFSLGTPRNIGKNKRLKAISYLGKISYAFFLVQFFAWKVGKWSIYFIGFDTNWLRILVTLTYCTIAAMVLYEVIQKPIDKYLRKKMLKQ